MYVVVAVVWGECGMSLNRHSVKSSGINCRVGRGSRPCGARGSGRVIGRPAVALVGEERREGAANGRVGEEEEEPDLEREGGMIPMETF